MAGSVNKVVLVGNVGKDPEIRRTQDGKAICNLSLATSESWRDKQTGERKERTEWHRVVIFNEGLAKIAEQYVKKGSKVYVEGQLQTRKWTDQQDIERYSTEIVLQGFGGALTLLDSRKSDDDQPQRERPADIRPPGGNAPQKRGSMKDHSKEMDDEIPFEMEWR